MAVKVQVLFWAPFFLLRFRAQISCQIVCVANRKRPWRRLVLVTRVLALVSRLRELERGGS